MPIIVYTETEYNFLQDQNRRLIARNKSLERLIPVKDISDQITSVALAEIWNALGVDNQTDCMTLIRQYTLPY